MLKRSKKEAVVCKHCGRDLTEAEKQPEKGKKETSNTAKGCTVLLVLILSLGVCVYVSVEPEPPQSPDATSEPPISIGDVAVLSWSDSDAAGYLAVDDASWDLMFEAITARDNVGLSQLVQARRVYVVPTGTKARVLEFGFTSYKVRLMDGPSAGAAGWVVREFVQPD